MRCFSFLLLMACCTNVCSAVDIYVDNIQGDDRNQGRASQLDAGDAGPVRTIAKALRITNKGDRVILKNTGTPYRESITFQARRNSGYPGSPFVFVGNGATLDGSLPILNSDWEHIANDVYMFCPHLKTYQQVFRDDVPMDRVELKSEEELDQLQPLQWTMVHGNIYFKAEKNKGPGSYNLSYSGQTVGITLYQVKYLRIEDLTVQGYQLDGVNAHDLALDVELKDVTSRGNGRSGISIGGASTVQIERAKVGNNGAAQLRTEGFSKTKVINSDLIGNTAPAIVQDGGKIELDGKPFEAK